VIGRLDTMRPATARPHFPRGNDLLTGQWGETEMLFCKVNVMR
jgi:hypothetical protein